VEGADAEKRKGRFLPMSLSLLSAVLLSTAVMNVEVDALPYVAPPSPWWPSYSYVFSRGNSILREQGERLLLRDKDPDDAYGTYAVIVLVNAKYERVRATLQELVAARWGILEEQENAVGPISMKPPTSDIVNENLRWPILGEGLARLRGSASSQMAQEYQLTSQPYNKIESVKGYSQAVIRISDGAPLFDRSVTVLQVTRTDWSREWARTQELHWIFPLPYKEDRQSVGIVTSTEIALIEELKPHLPGVAIRYFLAPGGFVSDSRGERVKNIEAVREKMEEALEQLKKP
jgi:hypothetical protein